MNDQVIQQRKVFGLITALHQAVDGLVLFYNPNELCLKAMKSKVDRISKTLDTFCKFSDTPLAEQEEPPYPDR